MFTHSIYAIQTAAIDPFDAAKALSGDNVKIFGWQPSAVHFMCHFFGPESVGGKGNVRLIVEEEVKKTGKPLPHVAMEVRSDIPILKCRTEM